MEVIVKKIGKLISQSNSFTAYEGCTLYSVQLISPINAEITRFVSFSSHDTFELLSPQHKLRALFNNELNKDDLSLMLTEYIIVKKYDNILSAEKLTL